MTLSTMTASVRKATPGDAASIARVHVAAWQSTYRGIMPQPFLDSVDAAQRTESWKDWLTRPEVHVYVAETGGEVCGFVSGGALQEPVERYDAEVYAIYLLPSARRSGTGKLLMQQIAATLRAGGFTQLAVWVLAENPARAFYERLGATQIAQKSIEIGGAKLLEIAYGWPDLVKLCD